MVSTQLVMAQPMCTAEHDRPIHSSQSVELTARILVSTNILDGMVSFHFLSNVVSSLDHIGSCEVNSVQDVSLNAILHSSSAWSRVHPADHSR